jgi:hypothetical protein
VHACDDAFVNRQPGVPLDQHLPAALLTLALALLAIVAFPRVRPGLRALLALVFGVFALANGMLHVIHIGSDGSADSDLTGALAAVAGVALLALAVWPPIRHRGDGACSRGRRWANWLVAVVAGVAVVYFVDMPVAVAIVSTHKYRERIGAPPSAAYQPVTFTASDGVKLDGWYVPSKNRAAVVLVHGGGGGRTGPLSHAALLARDGYGVLVYDSRGRGTSEGAPNQFGWDWDKDVAGALAFLRRRPDVDPDRIGGLGLLTGADVLMQVAARRDDALSAVVGDGASGESFADAQNRGVAAIDLPVLGGHVHRRACLVGVIAGPGAQERRRASRADAAAADLGGLVRDGGPLQPALRRGRARAVRAVGVARRRPQPPRSASAPPSTNRA